MSSALVYYLETAVFFPVLHASPVNYPSKRQKLAAAQQNVINVLRTTFYPHSTTGEQYALTAALTSPPLTRLWKDLQSLGFQTPLDQTIQKTCHSLL